MGVGVTCACGSSRVPVKVQGVHCSPLLATLLLYFAIQTGPNHSRSPAVPGKIKWPKLWDCGTLTAIILTSSYLVRICPSVLDFSE